MFFSETIELIRIAIDALNNKSKLDKEYFEQFIEPIWVTFNKIHQNYKDSYKEYMSTVQSALSTEVLLEIIRADSIYTDDYRSELKKLVINIPSVKFKGKEKTLAHFVRALDGYFESPEASFINLRYGIIKEIQRKGYDLAKLEASNYFRYQMSDIQSRFEVVADAYYRLKKEILA